MRWTFLIALALAAPAAANTSEPAVSPTPDVAAVAWSYGLVSDRPSTKELMARLDRLCDSKRQRDQRRCEEILARDQQDLCGAAGEEGGAGGVGLGSSPPKRTRPGGGCIWARAGASTIEGFWLASYFTHDKIAFFLAFSRIGRRGFDYEIRKARNDCRFL